MNISFLDAAGEVTGSCYLLKANGHRVLVEYGLFQGSRKSEKRNSNPYPFKHKEITAVIQSHAHLDHSGRIPKLVKDGFEGKVYAQRATVDLCRTCSGMQPILVRISHYIWYDFWEADHHDRHPEFRAN